MNRIKKILFIFIVSIGCKEAYNPPRTSPDTGYLVVEGFISSGEAPTSILLSRTVGLDNNIPAKYEANASVAIEGDNNEHYPLQEGANGLYQSASLTLDRNTKYRLHISTKDGKEYLSDFTNVKTGPPIDSVSWVRESDGVHIYINTHDPTGETRYYQWQYEETWEFHSWYTSSLVYARDNNNQITSVVYKYPSHGDDTTIIKCWKTINSSTINIGSSEKLVEDRIYLPMIFIEQGSIKLSYLYSVNMRQHALSKEAYRFLDKMKKNTEQLGSIFDPQPSELQGNIHCVTSPDEPVIGFVEVSEEKQERIYISKAQVPNWGYSPGCTYTEIDNNPDSIRKYGGSLYPATPSKLGPLDNIIKFNASAPTCIDCTLMGTNQKPSFWP